MENLVVRYQMRCYRQAVRLGDVRRMSKMSPATGHFTSDNPQTQALFRTHGYNPDSCLLHRVPWGDQDSYGHVNNVQYIRCKS